MSSKRACLYQIMEVLVGGGQGSILIRDSIVITRKVSETERFHCVALIIVL